MLDVRLYWFFQTATNNTYNVVMRGYQATKQVITRMVTLKDYYCFL